MKKIFRIILPAILVLTLLGCNNKQDDIAVPVEVYYRNTAEIYNDEESVITSEIWDFEGYENNLEGFLNLYLQGPATEECISPFSTSVQVVDLQSTKDRLCITMNDSYEELTGLDLTIASACIAKTIMGLTGCDAVEITCLNTGSSVIIDQETLLLLDDSTPSQS